MTEANSIPKPQTRKPRRRKLKKPAKPYPDFPLFPHATKRWAKKILGKFHYFGPWNDPDAALQRYLDQKGDLHAGRTPHVQADGLTVRDLLNRFLIHKRHLLDARELGPQSFGEYHEGCQRGAQSCGFWWKQYLLASLP